MKPDTYRTRSQSIKTYFVSVIGAVLSTLGIWMYICLGVDSEFNPFSVLMVFIFAAVVFLYLHICSLKEELTAFRKTAVLFSFIFSLFMAWGKYLDLSIGLNRAYLIVMTICLCFVINPLVLIAVNWLNSSASFKTVDTLIAERICFVAIILIWLLGYLAMYPGVYAVDAMTWYREFSVDSFPITDQWSPIYAGLFYLFVEIGHILYGSYELGLAVFSALQMIFILVVVRNVLHFIGTRCGIAGVILASAFYLLPVHTIMACQTIQGAPFMACFAMLLMHLVKMYEVPGQYWNWKNVLKLGFWCLLCCMLRNNAFIMLAGFMLFITLYHKGYRRYLLFVVVSILALSLIYKGPILNAFGVQKSDSLREMLSMPLQQMACAYNNSSNKLTDFQKKELRGYIKDEALEMYSHNPSISDHIKGGLDTERVKADIVGFVRLYISIGIKAPVSYLEGAYMQDLGLIYIDKRYPDPRMWHPYLNYASYDLHNDAYITIKRESLFPAYNQLLGKLFGYATNGYGGDVVTIFSDIPVLGLLCRVSLYFWIIVFLIIYGIRMKQKGLLFLLGICIMFTLTIVLSPVIMYRYYAPVVFGIPIIITYAKNSKGNRDAK